MISKVHTSLIVLSFALLLAACQTMEVPAVPSPGSVEVVPTTTGDDTTPAATPNTPLTTTVPTTVTTPLTATAPAPDATVAVTPTVGIGPASTPQAVATTPAAEVDPAAAPVGDIPEAATIVQQALADELGIALEDVTIVSFEWMEWPDSCLGAGQPDEMCAAVITPGYQVVLEAEGRQHQYHTNDDGSVWRVLESRF